MNTMTLVGNTKGYNFFLGIENGEEVANIFPEDAPAPTCVTGYAKEWIAGIKKVRWPKEWKLLPGEQEIISILRHHPLMVYRGSVIGAYVVGSFYRGDFRPDSDIDILLWVPKQEGFDDQSFTEFNRRRIQNYFMKNKIMGKADHVHPQFKNRRVDVYFTFNKPTNNCVEII